MKNPVNFKWFSKYYFNTGIFVFGVTLLVFMYLNKSFKSLFLIQFTSNTQNFYNLLYLSAILFFISIIYFVLSKIKFNQTISNVLKWVSSVIALIIGLLIFSGLLFLVFSAINSPIKTTTTPLPRIKQVIEDTTTQQQDFDFNYTEQQIEEAINNFREKNGKTRLEVYEPLCDLAKIRSYEIRDNWSHQGFENRGVITGNATTFTKYCSQGTVECTSVGENLAKNYPTVEEVIKGWENSTEGHKENMLGDYNVQCVGVIDGYVASLFAYVTQIPETTDSNSVKITDLVSYDFEKVKLWESRRNQDEIYKANWEGAYSNQDYNKEQLDKLIQTINNSIDKANYLWDGYTNSKFTYKQAIQAENDYYALRNQAAEITQQLNQQAFENCKNYWEEVYEEYETKQVKEQIENCERYIK